MEDSKPEEEVEEEVKEEFAGEDDQCIPDDQVGDDGRDKEFTCDPDKDLVCDGGTSQCVKKDGSTDETKKDAISGDQTGQNAGRRRRRRRKSRKSRKSRKGRKSRKSRRKGKKSRRKGKKARRRTRRRRRR